MGILDRRLVLRVRRVAKRKQLPLSHLADRAGIARSHLWSVLRGRSSPTLLLIERIANVLGVDPGDLLRP